MSKSIKAISNTVKSVVKNPLDPKNLVKTTALTGAGIGGSLLAGDKITGAVDSLMGGSGGPGPAIDQSAFNAQDAVNKQIAASREASLGLINDLQKQSRGEGPSLADATLKAQMDKSLQQQMAAAASTRGANPALAQRLMAQQQGAASRDLVQQGAQAKLQERQLAQQQLGNLTIGQQSQDLSQIMQPANLRAQGESARFQADVAKDNAIKQQQTAVLSGLLGGGASLLTAGLSNKPAVAAAPQNAAKGGWIEAPEVVDGDDEANDIVPVMLSGDEIVIPKSATESPEKAISFVQALFEKTNSKESAKKASYSDVLAARKKQ